MNQMILHHGTLTRNVEAILRDGLRPRGIEPSHDAYLEHPSLPEFVYLTDHLGLAMSHAIRISERVHSGAPVSIIEVTVSDRSKLLYPDEDFLTDEWNSDMPDWPVSKQMEYMEYHRREWRKSLEHTRTVAYRGGINATSLSLWDDLFGVRQWHRDKWQQRQQKLSDVREGKLVDIGKVVSAHRCCGDRRDGAVKTAKFRANYPEEVA